jgi:hypothetical protein
VLLLMAYNYGLLGGAVLLGLSFPTWVWWFPLVVGSIIFVFGR